MKVSFLNPPRFEKKISESFALKLNVARFSRGVDIVYGVTPPTELATLAARVREKHTVKILDANGLNLLPRQIYKWILDNKPDYLVIKTGDSTLLDDLSYYYFAEGIGIKAIVWEDILNPVYSDKFENGLNIKRLLWGEPENAVNQFFDGAMGIIGGEHVKELDALPIPALDLLPMDRYKKEGRRNWYMFLHRGCGWGKCRFCLMEAKDIRFRMRSIDHIRKELDLLKSYDVETIYFWDPQFNPTKQRVLELCELLSEYHYKWECWMRCDPVDREIISSMKQSGCFRIHFGVESGHQKILDSIRKGTTPQMIEKAFLLATQLKIETVAYLCCGTIEEDENSFRATIRLLNKIKPTTIVPAVFRPFPGVSLARDLKEQGHLVNNHFQLALVGKCFGDSETNPTNHLNASEVSKYMKQIQRLSTITAIKSYLKKPGMWKEIIKIFFIRSLRQISS